MKSINKIAMLLMLLAPCGVMYAADAVPTTHILVNHIQYDHVVWDGIPISFSVPVGQERILKFPGAVSLHNTNVKLTTDKVSIINNAGFLYIKAKKPFNAIRVPFIIKKTGQVLLIDLSAKKNSTDTPVSVLLGGSSDDQGNSKSVTVPQAVNFVSLIRFGIQHLFSPARLIAQQTNISRTPMYTTRSVSLFNNENVTGMPLISWRGGDLYVTAVLLKNVWDNPIVLDPRNIKGRWLAASFYPRNQLGKKGTLQDRTTMFLVSDRPFNSALNDMRGYI